MLLARSSWAWSSSWCQPMTVIWLGWRFYTWTGQTEGYRCSHEAVDKGGNQSPVPVHVSVRHDLRKMRVASRKERPTMRPGLPLGSSEMRFVTSSSTEVVRGMRSTSTLVWIMMSVIMWLLLFSSWYSVDRLRSNLKQITLFSQTGNKRQQEKSNMHPDFGLVSCMDSSRATDYL